MTDYDAYLAYLQTGWQSLPYLIVGYVLLTLLPKSLLRMKRFADADYEANRYKYHRCYGEEHCCHAQQAKAAQQTKTKQRKPVTRVYPKRQQSQSQQQQAQPAAEVAAPIKRSNVTKIARMFETGATRQVNRVSPVTLPEIRMFGVSEDSRESTPCASRKGSIGTQLSAQLQHIEHSMELWQQLEEELPAKRSAPTQRSDWHSEPMAVPLRRHLHGGTSATPSTASPLSSSPEPASPVLLRQSAALCPSMEDIFQAIARSAEQSDAQCLYAGCHSLAPVTSIDDILSERRFSRPLSAYSITDLLNEEHAVCVDETTYVNETLDELQLS